MPITQKIRSSLQKTRHMLALCARAGGRGYKVDVLDDPAPSSQQQEDYTWLYTLKPYFKEEQALRTEITLLKNLSSSLVEATGYSTDPLVVSSSVVFDSWATLRVASVQERLNCVSEDIQKMCDRLGVRYNSVADLLSLE